MENQARKRQELDLWQVVLPPENTKKVRRTGNAGPRPVSAGARPVRIGNARPEGNINTRPGAAGKIVQVRPAAPARQRNPKAHARALKRRAARRRKVLLYRCIALIWTVLMAVTVISFGKFLYENFYVEEKKGGGIKPVLTSIPATGDNSDAKKPQITEDFLTVSEYNRPGTKLARVNNIFVHYTANPGTSAAQNRSYFENLGKTHERAASAHFIIGYEGEIIQCIPLGEEAYAVVDRNKDSVSIECCFINEDGSFTQETYDSLVQMLAWLTDKYNLDAKDILRHYDCGGKLCPIYYVEHEDAWERLLKDVENYNL